LDEGPEGEYAEQMCNDLEELYHFLGITCPAAGEGSFFAKPRPILVNARLTCIFCLPSEGIHSLRRRKQPQRVRLLGSDFQWVEADLFLAFCQSCEQSIIPTESRTIPPTRTTPACNGPSAMQIIYVSRSTAYGCIEE
jgi:hypothetical protein